MNSRKIRQIPAFVAVLSILGCIALRTPDGMTATPVMELHGSIRSRIWHNAGCRFHFCSKCIAVFRSREDAQKAGYRPCKVCGG